MNAVTESLAHSSLAIFPPQSVTLVTSSSNSGKTHFLRQVVGHSDVFFAPNQVLRVVYINGANSAESWSPLDVSVPLESLSLQEVESHDDWLEEGDLIILDDLLQLTPGVIKLLKYSAHHRNATVFVVTQSLIGDRLYALTYLVHYCVLLLHTSTAGRVAVELLQRFFVSADTKRYLRDIISVAEKQQSVVVLKLNPVASAPRLASRVLCFSRVERLASERYCLVHPELAFMEELNETFSPLALEGVPDHQLVLVPAGFVKKKSDAPVADDEGAEHRDCPKEKLWAELNVSLNSDIEAIFAYKKWVAAKSLAREVLKNPRLCISHDFRQIIVKDHPKLAFNFIDFLQVAVRKAGPNEDAQAVSQYRPLVEVLLAEHIPRSFLVNRHLLPKLDEQQQPHGARSRRLPGGAQERHLVKQRRGL